MRGAIERMGHVLGDVQHAVFDGEQLRFTTSGSLALAAYRVHLDAQEHDVLVVALARDGRGPLGEQAPGRTRVTAVVFPSGTCIVGRAA